MSGLVLLVVALIFMGVFKLLSARPDAGDYRRLAQPRDLPRTRNKTIWPAPSRRIDRTFSVVVSRGGQPSPPAAPPEELHRDVLSDDPAEQALLSAIRADPSDGAARMVYADLLEQRGQLAQASFVRGTDENDDPAVLLDASELPWRAIVARDRADCGRTTCPRSWDLFVPVKDDERRRDCFLCKKAVRYCATVAEERACAERGERAVIDLGGAPRRR